VQVPVLVVALRVERRALEAVELRAGGEGHVFFFFKFLGRISTSVGAARCGLY
jgi:hypothetical protein